MFFFVFFFVCFSLFFLFLISNQSPSFSTFMSPIMGGWGGGHIVFSADPVGVGVGVATCLNSISLLNGQILAKLTKIYHWEGEKC